jgi:hypothetical protein
LSIEHEYRCAVCWLTNRTTGDALPLRVQRVRLRWIVRRVYVFVRPAVTAAPLENTVAAACGAKRNRRLRPLFVAN